MIAPYANDSDSKEYREIQSQLIYNGQYREVVDMDIEDLIENFVRKYEKGIKQMEIYIRILENAASAADLSK